MMMQVTYYVDCDPKTKKVEYWKSLNVFAFNEKGDNFFVENARQTKMSRENFFKDLQDSKKNFGKYKIRNFAKEGRPFTTWIFQFGH